MASSTSCALGVGSLSIPMVRQHQVEECHQQRGSGAVSTSYSNCSLGSEKHLRKASAFGKQLGGLRSSRQGIVYNRGISLKTLAMRTEAHSDRLSTESASLPEDLVEADTITKKVEENLAGPGASSRWLAGALALLTGALMALQGPQMALAGVQKVGEFTGSGFIFKDSIQVMSIDDPKVSGVTIFVSDFQRSLTDRLAKDFFNEPSQASITCAQTSPLRIAGSISGKEGEEIFSETKNFLAFKTLHVRRIFDEKKNALVYVAYSTRFQSQDNDKVSAGRYRTSICTVPLFNAVVQSNGAAGDGSG